MQEHERSKKSQALRMTVVLRVEAPLAGRVRKNTKDRRAFGMTKERATV
jgi:hypothetical protein